LISRLLHLIFILFASSSIYGQILIEELTIDFDESDRALVRVLNDDRDCDSNIGIFGIMEGAFVINDVEGATCCSNSPLQGMNDNRALLGPVLALNPYCDVSITIDVSLSATNFESCLSRDISPIGCTAFIPTFDPGGDGFQLETMLNGDLILSSGYCGQQRRGIFTLNIGDIEIGDVFTFLITGGTQDEEEVYSINSIEFTGRPRSLIPAMISTSDSVLCEGLDPLILTEISGGSNYQWSRNGSILPSTTFSYNSGGVVSPADEGLYRVTVTDAGGCISIDEINIEVVPLASKLIEPTFSNLILDYCVGDTIVLPETSDEGVSGIWNITTPFVLEQGVVLDSLHFDPNDILFSPVSFPLTLQNYIMATYRDTICAGATLTLEGEIFDSSRLQGTYISDGGEDSCDTLYAVSLSLARVDTSQFNQTVCPGDTFNIGGELFHFGRLSDGVLVSDDDLCISFVEVTLTLGTVMATRVFDPCIDIPLFEDVILRRDTTILISGNGIVCDSIINILYQPELSQDSILNFILCPDDSVVIENQIFNANNSDDTLIVINDMGCPINYIVHLEFMEEVIIPFDIVSICMGDTIQVENELFYAGKLNGLVLINDGGCDTLIEVDLQLRQSVEEVIQIDPCSGTSEFRQITISSDTTIVVFGSDIECDTIYNIDYNPGFIGDSTLQISLCMMDSILLSGTQYHASNTTGQFEILEESGCRRVVNVEIEIEEEVIQQLRDTLCNGAELLVANQIFDAENPQGRIVFSTNDGCDTVLLIDLEFIQTVEQDLSITICEGDTILIQGQEFYNGLNDVDPILYGPNGCDTLLTVTPTYFTTRSSTLQMSFCSDETIVVGGETFSASRPMGSVSIPLDNGCDSIVDVQLDYANSDTINVTRQLCVGQELVIGGVAYNAANSTGFATLISSSGCDSILDVNLSFGETINTKLEPLICPNEQIFIGSQFYNVSNPSGVESYTSSAGCDSIVEIQVQLDTVEVMITATGTCRQSRTGTIEVEVLSQDTFEISLAGETFANPATSVVFEDLAIGEYAVVVESARGCFFVYPTLVEATFANEVSYTLEDNSADFYDVSVNISGPFQDIIWEPSSDLSCIDCLTPTIRKGGNGEYRAIVQDLNGCIAVVEIIIIEEAQVFLYLPNVITLNGSPNNSTFYLQTSDEGVSDYDMQIYDRWGQPMFDNEQLVPNDPDVGWNGLRKGEKVSSGVYVYNITIRLEDGTEEMRLGELLVIN